MGVNEWDAFQLLYTATVYVPQTFLCFLKQPPGVQPLLT